MMSMGLSMRDRDPVDYERSMRSVFVGNIPYEATEDQLKDIFNEVGNVISFRLVFDRESGKPKGYGFAEYQDQETALSAMRNLNQRELHGRQLRVDTATSEKNRTLQEEMAQMSSGGLPVESDFGDPTASKDAPEAISKAVASLPPEQMFELMKQMKQCIQNNPVEARNMLLQNPQLAYALLQAQVVMRIVDPEIAMKMLHRQNPMQPLIGEEQKKLPDQDRPNGNLPGLGGFPDERATRDHLDIRDIPVDRMMERGPLPPRARMDADLMDRVPVDRSEPMDRGRGSPHDRHRPPLMDHPEPFGRDQRHMDRGPRDRGPPGDRHGPIEPHGMSPRDMDRPPMDRRPPMGRDMHPGPPHGRDGPMGRDLPPMGRDMPPMGHPRGGFDQDREMMDRGPRRGPPPDHNDPRRGRGAPPPREDVPAEQDQEKAALIMQVLQLTPQQIEMLPEEQRQSILALKDQLQGRQ